jgi:hypothetical protein
MKNQYIKSIIWALPIFIVISCNDKLDLTPRNETTSEKVFGNLTGYEQSLAKVYGSFATTGSGGPGSTDLPFGGDPGWSDFFRSFWKAQELTTEEAAVAWSGDAGLQDFNTISYSSNNAFVQRNFSRPLFQIVLANEFIRECSDERLERRGISGVDAEKIRIYKQEARFLRAYQYWVLLDLFRNPPFVTEANDVGKFLPPQTNANALYSYIESELLITSNLLNDDDLEKKKINKAADPNQGAETKGLQIPLLTAVLKGYASIAKILLDNGAYCSIIIGKNSNNHFNDGETLIDIAKRKRDYDMLQILSSYSICDPELIRKG